MDGGLFEFVSKVGNIYSLIAVIVVVLGFILYNKFDKIIEFFKAKPKVIIVEKKVSDLINHSIFYKFDDMLIKVKSMEFTTHGKLDIVKTRLLHKLIEFQLETIKNTLLDILINPETQIMNENQMKSKVMGMNSKVIAVYNLRAKNVFVNDYGILAEHADKLIDTYARFRREFHNSFESQMEGIPSNNDYNNNYLKASALLEVVSMSLYSIPAYAVLAMDDINGTFRNYDPNKIK